MSMNNFHLIGYDTTNQFSENSETSVGVFALVVASGPPPVVVTFKPIYIMFF